MSINHLSFNNTKSIISCCTDQGYIIYSINPHFEKKIYNSIGGIGLMKMFNKSNIALLVGGGSIPFKSNNCVILRDQLTNKNIIEINMKNPVKNVLITKDKMVATTENKITLFAWDGRLLDQKDTYSNENGICVINMNLNIIATLGTKKGEVAIWKYGTDLYKSFEAHLTNIEAIGIDNAGKLVATASEIGTLIRIFNTDNGKLEYEFRRGAQSANIYDICFNDNSTMLACSSGNGTIHIYDLNKDQTESKNVQSVMAGLKNYLPKYFSSQWGFKQITLGDTARSICCFDENDNLHVVTYSGNYYKIVGGNNEFKTITHGGLHINNK